MACSKNLFDLKGQRPIGYTDEKAEEYKCLFDHQIAVPAPQRSQTPLPLILEDFVAELEVDPYHGECLS